MTIQPGVTLLVPTWNTGPEFPENLRRIAGVQSETTPEEFGGSIARSKGASRLGRGHLLVLSTVDRSFRLIFNLFMFGLLRILALSRTCPPASLQSRILFLVCTACLSGLGGACRSPDPVAEKAEAVRRGDAFVERKQYNEAIAAYRGAVTSDPMDGVARLKLASAYGLAERWAEAGQEGIRAADLMPGNLDAERLAIGAFLSGWQFIDAVDRAALMLKSHPDDPRLLVLFANAKANLSSSKGVFVELEEAFRLGRDFDEARVGLRPPTLQSNDRIAEQVFRRVLDVDPTMSDARMGLISLLWVTGRLEEGAEVLSRAADAEPGHAFLNRALGVLHQFRGRDAEAEKYLKVAASSNDRESQLALADFYIARKRGEVALPMLEKVAAGDDPDSAAALRAANIEFRLGRIRTGIEASGGDSRPEPA